MFEILFYQPIFNFLIFIYHLAGDNLGMAVIAVALVSRLIMFPFTQKQLENAEKAKDMRKDMDRIKKKYAKNKEKQAEEMSKLQAKHLPGQLAGCLPLILMIVFFFQIRGTISDLVNEGWYSFNRVAYVQSMKEEPDSIMYKQEEELALGEHTLKVDLKSEKGNTLSKEFQFEIVEDVENRVEEIKEEERTKSSDDKKEKEDKLAELQKQEKQSDMAVFNKTLDENKQNIAVQKIVFFTLDSTERYLLTDRTPDLDIYVRPPSKQRMLASETKIYLDGNEITDKSEIKQGEPLNLSFFNVDLSKTAYDIGLNNIAQVWPYILLAILVGISQFGSTWITTNVKIIGDTKPKAPEQDKKKKKDEAEPDFSDMMQSSSKQMLYILPVMTAFFSLNFISGLSLYWTVQSLFVIIQQLFRERKKLVEWVKVKINKPATSELPLKK